MYILTYSVFLAAFSSNCYWNSFSNLSNAILNITSHVMNYVIWVWPVLYVFFPRNKLCKRRDNNPSFIRSNSKVRSVHSTGGDMADGMHSPINSSDSNGSENSDDAWAHGTTGASVPVQYMGINDSISW